MIFSSPQFILLFLPAVFLGYFWLNRAQLVLAGKWWLVMANLFFYASWNFAYLPLLVASMSFNFLVGTALNGRPPSKPLGISRRFFLAAGVAANLALLGYFKYAHFLVANINSAFDLHVPLSQILLPLGVSFFTFTQIAYLVDSYRGEAERYNFLDYILFASFFPYLIAGPILHHREMISQFKLSRIRTVRYENIALGLFIFSLGLFKKVILADTFAIWADPGFDSGLPLDFFRAWATSLSYTFQLYFDFSGYCDMGIGAALFFNINLPINFNSPYKAMDIQDFWRRWHMTLSRFLREYLYIPLGGNRRTVSRVYLNIMVTFLLGGLWHGASWMFVTWGALHGAALVLHRAWKRCRFKMPGALAWLLTFGFVNVAWVFFRARTMDDALRVLRGMVDVGSVFHLPVEDIPTAYLAWGGWLSDYLLTGLPNGLAMNILCFGAVTVAFTIVSQKNSIELMKEGGYSVAKLSGALVLFCVAVYAMMVTESTVFLYAKF